MTSATVRSDSGAGGRHAEGRGIGLIFFASILLLVAGFFNMIYGIAAIAQSHVFVANAHYVFGNLRAWGWISSHVLSRQPRPSFRRRPAKDNAFSKTGMPSLLAMMKPIMIPVTSRETESSA